MRTRRDFHPFIGESRTERQMSTEIHCDKVSKIIAFRKYFIEIISNSSHSPHRLNSQWLFCVHSPCLRKQRLATTNAVLSSTLSLCHATEAYSWKC